MVIEYRSIPSAPGYLIGADGSIIGKRGNPLKQGKNGQGRPQFACWVIGYGRKTIHSHQAVCEAFHGPRPPGHEVAHLNGDLSDNRAENLQWKTHKENVADKVRHGTDNRGERHYRCKLTDADVLAIRESGDKIMDLAARYGISWDYTYMIKTGRRRNWGASS